MCLYEILQSTKYKTKARFKYNGLYTIVWNIVLKK